MHVEVEVVVASRVGCHQLADDDARAVRGNIELGDAGPHRPESGDPRPPEGMGGDFRWCRWRPPE